VVYYFVDFLLAGQYTLLRQLDDTFDTAMIDRLCSYRGPYKR